MILPRFGRSVSFFLFGSAVMPAMAQAQTPPPAVPVAPPTREEIQRGQFDTADEQARAKLSVDDNIERTPCPLADERFENIRVTISDVQFNNLPIVSPESLRPAWIKYVGQSVPVATICEIRDAASAILRRDGYLAMVQVPPQRIEENGIVKFNVVTAKMVGIQVRGNPGNSEAVITRYLNAIKDQPYFNVNKAERYLLLARDLPGLDVRLSLRPAGTVPGEVIGDISVVHRLIDVDANFQNYGSTSVGRFGGLARVQLNGLTGMGDATSLGFYSTSDFEEQKVVQLTHSFKVGREGLTFSGDFTYAWTRPSITAGVFKSNTLVTSLTASYPIIRRQTQNLFASGGMDLVNQELQFGPTTISRDKLRVAFARLEYDSIDPASLTSKRGFSAAEPQWRINAAWEIRQGVNIFDANKSCGVGFANCLPPSTPPSRLTADPTSLVLRVTGSFEYRPMPKLMFALSPRAQYSPKSLYSYEQFSAGNYTAGRGFNPGTLVGDSGIGIQAEVRIGSLIPRKTNHVAVQPYAFFDAARIWTKDPTAIGFGDKHLYSAGGGVRAAWGNHARLDATFALPLNRAGLQTKKADPRFLVSLTVKLLPWTL